LKIEPGTTNAIVSPVGFDKTTLFNLLMRLYETENGKILLDGQDIADLKFQSFRKYIAMVPQSGNLFNDTIIGNLKYSDPDAEMWDVIDVCKKCQIHDKIMSMKDGYYSKVGDLGGVLSGGERQRIVIARSLLKKDAQIFLFDEATSALDSATEKQIADELDTMMVGKTVIYCAHRLSSIKNVQRIHVLSDGKVEETGSHEELIAKEDSIYNRMWLDYLREGTVDHVAAAVVA